MGCSLRMEECVNEISPRDTLLSIESYFEHFLLENVNKAECFLSIKAKFVNLWL